MPRRKDTNEEVSEAEVQKIIIDIKSGRYPSCNAAEKATGVNRSLLTRRLNGLHQSRAQAREQQQNLTGPEEKALVQWCSQLTVAGYPARHNVLREMAEEIRTRRVASMNIGTNVLVRYPPHGVNWSTRFVKRHPELNTVASQQIDLARWRDPTQKVLQHWFSTFKSQTRSILAENIYNMDETGFDVGTEPSSRVIVSQQQLRTRYVAHMGRQEWISVVECICADGSAIAPQLIFKGERINTNVLTDKTPDDWRFSWSSSGWTSNVHGLEWLQRCFDPTTREKASGRMRALICDGHDSHITGNFIAYCMDNGIKLLVLPPHASHLLQPLDLSVFGPLKTHLSRTINQTTRLGPLSMKKSEWVEAYCTARQQALRCSNVKSGFKNAGLFPFDPSVAMQHSPSGVTTDRSSTRLNPRSVLRPTTPEPILLQEKNKTMKRKLVRDEVLSSPTRHYIAELADSTERLQAQLAITQREVQDRDTLITSRKRLKSGKRLVIEGQVVLTTLEIRERVQAAEAAAAAKKRAKKPRNNAGRSGTVVEPSAVEGSEAEVD